MQDDLREQLGLNKDVNLILQAAISHSLDDFRRDTERLLHAANSGLGVPFRFEPGQSWDSLARLQWLRYTDAIGEKGISNWNNQLTFSPRPLRHDDVVAALISHKGTATGHSRIVSVGELPAELNGRVATIDGRRILIIDPLTPTQAKGQYRNFTVILLKYIDLPDQRLHGIYVHDLSIGDPVQPSPITGESVREGSSMSIRDAYHIHGVEYVMIGSEVRTPPPSIQPPQPPEMEQVVFDFIVPVRMQGTVIVKSAPVLLPKGTDQDSRAFQAATAQAKDQVRAKYHQGPFNREQFGDFKVSTVEQLLPHPDLLIAKIHTTSLDQASTPAPAPSPASKPSASEFVGNP